MAAELDGEKLESLLNALAPDREAAAEKYESLRRRLIDLFSWERCAAAEDLTDEALNRLASKLHQGTDIPHPDRYAFGIARLLIQEDARARRKQEAAVRELQAAAAHASERDEHMLEAIEDCLAALPRDSRKLIERYYAEDRASVARDFGISVNALRNRALRIREQLFKSIARQRDRW